MSDPRWYPSQRIERARKLRREQTAVEAILWRRLRDRQLAGYKFRRQHPIGPYIADFVCLSQKLVIELDGGQHADQKTRDQSRDAFLAREGFRVLRVWNNMISENLLGVLESILKALEHQGGARVRPPP